MCIPDFTFLFGVQILSPKTSLLFSLKNLPLQPLPPGGMLPRSHGSASDDHLPHFKFLFV